MLDSQSNVDLDTDIRAQFDSRKGISATWGTHLCPQIQALTDIIIHVSPSGYLRPMVIVIPLIAGTHKVSQLMYCLRRVRFLEDSNSSQSHANHSTGYGNHICAWL
jgi:hypothetical protein